MSFGIKYFIDPPSNQNTCWMYKKSLKCFFYAARLFLKFGYSQYAVIIAVNLFEKLDILEIYYLKQTIFINNIHVLHL